MISVQKLSHSFGTKKVLNDISFDVSKGEILVIMGSSGGGKTTLLKCMAGLLTIQVGDVLYDETSMKVETEKAQKLVGLVFQYAALFDYLNVAENVLFGVRRKTPLSHQEMKNLVAKHLEEVGLQGTENLMPNELSGGMKKRVGLARALAMTPDVLMYDEPTSGLDPVTAYSIDQLIVETSRRTRATSIVVSHDVSSVMRVADRIAFLDQGQLVFLGTPQEFKMSKQDSIADLVSKSVTETLS